MKETFKQMQVLLVKENYHRKPDLCPLYSLEPGGS